MTDLKTLAIADLVPHPDNPRLQLREDVVDRIAAQIRATGTFAPEHALLVWVTYPALPGLARTVPTYEQYTIVSGHHRVEAAKRAGLAEVPCWVKEMSPDEAFMQLVLANTQGELSPLEYGIHALRYASLAQGQTGRGLQEYANRVGRDRGNISKERAAAEVLTSCNITRGRESDLFSRAYHLYEISKAPRDSWPLLVDRLLAKGWSVADTASQTDKVRKFEIPAEHADWLPYAAVVEAYLRSDRLNPAAVAKLISTAESVLAYIGSDGVHEDREAFTAWLRDHAGKESWDAKAIGRYHADLIREVAERRAAEAEEAAEEAPQIPDGVTLLHGDFREVLMDLSGVDAIITDPPYPAKFLELFGRKPPKVDPDTMISRYDEFEGDGLAEVAARILKPGGICAVMVGQSYLPEIIERLSGTLAYHWTLAYLTPGGQAVQLWDRKVNTFWKPVLIFTKGEYAGDWFGDVTRSDVNDNDKQHHHWGQSESGMADLIERLSKPGQLICDPFLGGGTTAVIAHELSRRFIGCDIDEACIATTTARFAEDEEQVA